MSTATKALVLLLTQENAADLHSFGTVAMTVEKKRTDPVKNMSLCHYMTFFLLVGTCLAFRFTASLKPHLFTALTTQNTKEVYIYIYI
jgi:hypothetical protein